MSSGSRWTLPNTITVLRIAACPAVLFVTLSESLSTRFAAFGLYLLAALSDLWDGYLARKHGWVSDIGKLLDPLADKLLLLSTFIPFFIISHRPGPLDDIPWWGPLPLWVMVLVFGRELAVTLFRSWASRRGIIIAAGSSGKYKMLFQSFFSGGLLLWYPLQQMALSRAWEGTVWRGWAVVHQGWVGATLAVAVFLTVYSMIDYFWSYRSLVGMR